MAHFKILEVLEQNGRMTVRAANPNREVLKLYWSESPDKSSTQMVLITETDGELTELDRPVQNGPVYIIAEDRSGERVIAGVRTLPVEGMNNFRDMGGYTGADGKTVRWGLLYRSDHLHSVTPAGIDFLKKLGIKTIVDYRSETEYTKTPNQFIGELKTIHLDPAAHTAELAAQFAAKPENENQAIIDNIVNNMKPEEINGSGEQVLVQYRGFVDSRKAAGSFAGLLNAIADGSNSPLLQHCRGGKDRTGFGVMLTLAMLGVSREEILYDFMLTGKNREARNQYKLNEYKQLITDQNVLDYLMSLIETREAFLEESISRIESKWGSILDYMKQVLGVSDEQIQAARAFYLE